MREAATYVVGPMAPGNARFVVDLDLGRSRGVAEDLMEIYLGREIRPDEVVYPADGDPANVTLDNLRLAAREDWPAGRVKARLREYVMGYGTLPDERAAIDLFGTADTAALAMLIAGTPDWDEAMDGMAASIRAFSGAKQRVRPEPSGVLPASTMSLRGAARFMADYRAWCTQSNDSAGQH
jgi:hypothetical protein